jgi:hypothetical protein
VPLLSILVLFAAALTGHAENSLSGRWEGLVQIPGREVNVVVDLDQKGGGGWTGSVTIPGLDIKGAELIEITARDAEIAFAIKEALSAPQAAPAKFKGRLNAQGGLTGDFIQGGNSAAFTLTKTGPPQVELPIRSTVVAKELEGEWIGDYELDGYGRHVTLKLINRGAEGASADFVVVGKRVNNLPVDLITQEGDFLSIDSHQTGIGYEGRIRKGAVEINGTLKQGPVEVPLVLRRSH